MSKHTRYDAKLADGRTVHLYTNLELGAGYEVRVEGKKESIDISLITPSEQQGLVFGDLVVTSAKVLKP